MEPVSLVTVVGVKGMAAVLRHLESQAIDIVIGEQVMGWQSGVVWKWEQRAPQW